MMHVIKQEIRGLLEGVGITGDLLISTPPKPDMGDFAFGCFALAKEQGKNPADVAKDLAARIAPAGFVARVEAFGPYVNFFINEQAVANVLLAEITERQTYGTHTVGAGKRYLVEYACPNPLKAFHLGHLKNLVTGEAVARMFENVGFDVRRVNYQGDVGLHIAKALWGIFDARDIFESMRDEDDIKKRVEFLGKCYASGATQYEKDEAGAASVVAYNEKIYSKDADIEEVYQTARQWSLDYFDLIYRRLGTTFDRFYFESEMVDDGLRIVREGVKKGIFKESEGAVIFEGSKYDLHDRVFINSKGFPTYEAKEIALAIKHFLEFSPEKVVHVVGKEQTEYFKVVFRALEEVAPPIKGREQHLVGGFLQLKGQEKMSSRTGRIITGDALLFLVEERVRELMVTSTIANKEDVIQKVTKAALKYAMLKADVSRDVAFDMEESVSTNGDSGPYLLYIVARIKSILRKAGVAVVPQTTVAEGYTMHEAERSLVLRLAQYPEITLSAYENLDPSHVTKYLFILAQHFNTFYQACPVLQAEDQETMAFRLALSQRVLWVMQSGLTLLGMESVEEM